METTNDRGLPPDLVEASRVLDMVRQTDRDDPRRGLPIPSWAEGLDLDLMAFEAGTAYYELCLWLHGQLDRRMLRRLRATRRDAIRLAGMRPAHLPMANWGMEAVVSQHPAGACPEVPDAALQCRERVRESLRRLLEDADASDRDRWGMTVGQLMLLYLFGPYLATSGLGMERDPESLAWMLLNVCDRPPTPETGRQPPDTGDGLHRLYRWTEAWMLAGLCLGDMHSSVWSFPRFAEPPSPFWRMALAMLLFGMSCTMPGLLFAQMALATLAIAGLVGALRGAGARYIGLLVPAVYIGRALRPALACLMGLDGVAVMVSALPAWLPPLLGALAGADLVMRVALRNLRGHGLVTMLVGALALAAVAFTVPGPHVTDEARKATEVTTTQGE